MRLWLEDRKDMAELKTLCISLQVSHPPVATQVTQPDNPMDVSMFSASDMSTVTIPTGDDKPHLKKPPSSLQQAAQTPSTDNQVPPSSLQQASQSSVIPTGASNRPAQKTAKKVQDSGVATTSTLSYKEALKTPPRASSSTT